MMIQDIAPHQFNNHYYPNCFPKKEDFVIACKDNSVLLKWRENAGEGVFPTVSEYETDEKLVYLFSIDDERYFMDLTTDDGKNINGFTYLDIRKIRDLSGIPKMYAFAAFTAIHLAKWYDTNRFCGKCGSRLMHHSSERAMRCENCGEVFYPRINPAVIVGVTNHDKLLLTKYQTGYRHNALVAGFTEIGETLEETVLREVMEEVGLKVKNIRYYKSQPWGMACDLLAGFFCEVDGDDKIKMDSHELRYAEWVERSEIELQPQEYSLTNEMMKVFKMGNFVT